MRRRPRKEKGDEISDRRNNKCPDPKEGMSLVCLESRVARADSSEVEVLEMTSDVKEVDRVQIMADLAGYGKGFAFYFKCKRQILQSLKLRKEEILYILYHQYLENKFKNKEIT